MHQSHDWELQTRVQSPVPAKFFSWDFSRFKYFERLQLDCFNGKKWFEGQQITWHCGMCCNPATGKVSFVDVWLSSKAINALWAESQFRPKFNGWGNPRGDLPRYKRRHPPWEPIALVVKKPVIRLYSHRLPHQKLDYCSFTGSINLVVATWIKYIWKGVEITSRSCPGSKWLPRKEKD